MYKISCGYILFVVEYKLFSGEKMPTPKRRTSKAKSRSRRSFNASCNLSVINKCLSCGELKVFHHLCKNCGKYNGVQIVNVT